MLRRGLARTSQPGARMGVVRACVRTCRAALCLALGCLWECMSEHGYSRQRLRDSTEAGVEASTCHIMQTHDGACASHVEAWWQVCLCRGASGGG